MGKKLMEIMEERRQLELEDAAERSKPPKGYPKSRDQYAVPDEYLFPIDSEKHVRAAISMFNRHTFKDEAQKKSAAKKILAAAKTYGIDVSKSSDVYKAAHGE